MKLTRLKTGEWIAPSEIHNICVEAGQMVESISACGVVTRTAISFLVVIRHGSKPDQLSRVECTTHEEAQAIADDLAGQVNANDFLQALSPRLRSETTSEPSPPEK